MAIEISNFKVAAALVPHVATAHAIVPTWSQGVDVADSATTGSAGVYDIVLAAGLPDAVMGANALEVGTNIGGSFTVVSIADAGFPDMRKRVTTRDSSGTPVNTMSFYIEFSQAPGYPASFVVPTGSING